MTKILNRDRITIDYAKDVSINELDVSLFTFLNQVVSCRKEKYAVVQSEKDKIKKTFQGSRPLVSEINSESYAYFFFIDQPQIEEIRGGEMLAKYWFIDALEDEVLYEESIFNPKYGTVLTLISK